MVGGRAESAPVGLTHPSSQEGPTTVTISSMGLCRGILAQLSHLECWNTLEGGKVLGSRSSLKYWFGGKGKWSCLSLGEGRRSCAVLGISPQDSKLHLVQNTSMGKWCLLVLHLLCWSGCMCHCVRHYSAKLTQLAVFKPGTSCCGCCAGTYLLARLEINC